jgi:hypothetical protein
VEDFLTSVSALDPNALAAAAAAKKKSKTVLVGGPLRSGGEAPAPVGVEVGGGAAMLPGGLEELEEMVATIEVWPDQICH